MAEMVRRLRTLFVAFVDEALKKAFEELKSNKHEERQLYSFLERAFDDLKQNPFCGIRIPSKLWPREYIREHKINNLWKYNLPNAWRLIYTVKGDEVTILAVILDWMNHKEYDRKFSYRS